MKKILIQLDTDPHPSPFDAIVAHDAGVEVLLSYAGVTLRQDDILLAAGGTATRRLTSPGPSYVVVEVAEGSAVVGSVTLTSPEGDIAGLATIPLTSPDVAGRAPRVEEDPAVAR